MNGRLPVNLIGDWHGAAQRIHERVIEASYDSLASRLASLHSPRRNDGDAWPVCHGCDREDSHLGDAVWPCRSYTVIATTMLRVADIETLLTETRNQMLRRG